MSKIQEKFEELRSKNEKALIAYIMVGFPNEKTTLTAINGLVKGGADIIELGFPFFYRYHFLQKKLFLFQ